MKVSTIFFSIIVSTIFISGSFSAILSSFRNRQREIRRQYLTGTLHDCNAKSKTLKLIKKYPTYDDRGYLPPKEIYSKNKYDAESAIGHLLLPPKISLYEKFIHGDSISKNKPMHDCKTSAVLKLLRKLHNQ